VIAYNKYLSSQCKVTVKIESAYDKMVGFGLVGLWCLTPLSTIFQLYRGGQFY
jgi:hypothetical protein